MIDYKIGDDLLVEDLLRAQRPPPRWTVYRVLLYRPHAFLGLIRSVCSHCNTPQEAHHTGREIRLVSLLKDGPLRRLTVLTSDLAELPKPARMWLNTLHNVANAAGAPLDGWIAYDGRGQVDDDG